MPHKNIRKLTRIGANSLGVILPKDWLRYYNLEYGDHVEVISNGKIEITPNCIAGGDAIDNTK